LMYPYRKEFDVKRIALVLFFVVVWFPQPIVTGPIPYAMGSVGTGQLSVSIFTDSISYNPGDGMTLYGYVRDPTGSPVSYASVSIQVNDPGGSPFHLALVSSYADGRYSDIFNLPMTARSGMYTAYATAYRYDYDSGSNYIFFSVPRATLSSLQARIFSAAPNTVYFIYPDYGHIERKLAGVGLAALSDWSAMGVVYGMCSNVQSDGMDTSPALVDLSSGSVTLSGVSVVVMGGAGVHNVVRYCENVRIAPLRFSQDALTCYFMKRDGSVVGSISKYDAMNLHKDMFVLEVFADLKGNTVLMAYGVTWKGTFAAGLYLKSVIASNLASYSRAWYVFKWDDSNGDGMIDVAEISEVASGD